MDTKYISFNCYWRITVLFITGWAMCSNVEAQTFNNANYIKDTQSLQVVHKQSFLADRADEMTVSFPQEFLQKNEGWKTNEYGKSVQNTSDYYTTRYVKKGTWAPLFLTTKQNTTTSDHKYYQRWYYYDANGNELPLPEEYYAPEFKAYVYSNGLVMGSRLYNYKNSTNAQNLSNSTVPVSTSLLCRLPQNMESLEIGGDISRYSDMSYAQSGTTAQASGNLTEPSLTIRHHYKLIDANVMARQLTSKTGDKWLEEHTIHFPNKTIGLRYDHVSLNLELQDYWFYRGGAEAEENLQNISSTNYITYEFYYPGGTNLGFNDLDLIAAPSSDRNNSYSNITNTTFLRRRMLKFSYPTGGQVQAGSKMEIRVYARESNAANAQRYNLARFILIFDGDSEVLPWMDIVGANADPELNKKRSPQGLHTISGNNPVAHIDFDYPKNQSFKNPPSGNTVYHGGGGAAANTAFPQSSALPLSYKHTSYGYAPFAADNVYNWCVWGEYGIGKESGQALKIYPVSRKTGVVLDDNLESGFLYIDASDLPGTVGSVPFQGTFCMGTKMMCSGWMASITDNKFSSNMPGSVILKVIGTKPNGDEVEIYAFCPGQIGRYYRKYNDAPGTLTNSSGEYCWQQFYFEFILNEPCVSYELRIENNCESTAGGDYFLDDVWVYAKLPSVGPQMTTPLCGGSLEVVQLETDFDALITSTGTFEAQTAEAADNAYLSFIYLDWDNFLLKFQEGLASMGINVTAHELQENINSGLYDVDTYRTIYHTAFSQSILRDTIPEQHKVIFGNYQWSSFYDGHPEFSFAEMAMDTQHTVYRMTDNGKRKLYFNGYMGAIEWEYYHNYALLTTVRETPMTEAEAENSDWISDLLFNVLNECSNRSILWFVPKVEIVGTIGGLSIEDLEFCEYTTQTFAMELAGYTRLDGYTDENGVHHPGDPVILPEVYFDWWMGVPKSEGVDSIPATVENYMKQYTTYTETVEGETVERKLYLYDAVRCFRFMNPDVTSLYSPNIKFGQNPLYANIPAFTPRMLEYMRSLANPSDGSKPQLYIHTKIVDVEINEENVVREVYLGDTIKYVKFVAIPIEANINEAAKDFVYICAEPQPFKVRVGDHAPHMQVGFSEKHYPAGLGTLSVRISKSQFEKLVDHEDGKGYKELHIPLRDINVVTPSCVGVKMATDPDDALRSVRIANSTDSLMQAFIMENMIFDENNSWPPAVGKIDYLVGKHDNYWSEGHPETERLLKIHFDKDFQVREGYSYTLRYYFIEDLNQGFQFTCNGNADIIIKIVPDYEVWTGGADNTDWSNDENWRRADYDELYAGNGTNLKDRYLPNGKQGDLPANTNYVTPADRERMQGFAPLYCTNILMMTKEKKKASSLYDDGDEVIDGEKTGFPALRATASPLIRYDFQTHEWVTDSVSAHSNWTHRALGDMVTELYNDNVCDSIAFQSETELVNAHLLNYNKAWVEFALPKNKWHLVSSPLRGTISGEWYAPTWSGRQETTYYEPITFDVDPTKPISMTSFSELYQNGQTNYGDPGILNYDRFAPAVYQRQWDKAKAVLYERGAVWSADDASQTQNLGFEGEGDWTGSGEGFSWDSANADEYLNRLVYKPFGDSKINVAVRGSWSGAHNDHTVPYDNGGFSVMPINNLKEHNNEDVKTIFRLPKDDQYYDIWDWGKSYKVERRVRIYIDDGRRDWPTGFAVGEIGTNQNPNDYLPNDENVVELKNRGRLRSDYFAEKAVTPEEVTTHIGSTTPGDLALYDLDKDGDIDASDVKEAVTPAAVKAHIGRTSAEELALYDRDKNGQIEAADTAYYVTLKNEGKGSMGYFLASNPFVCGLDMKKFFELNADSIYSYYLVMKDSDVDPQNSDLTDTYLATQPTGTEWKWTDMSFSGISDGTDLQGRKIVPPRYAFFLKKKEIGGKDLNQLTLRYTPDMMVHTSRDENGKPVGVHPYLSIFAERDGDTSEAMVMMSPNASNKFCPGEDMETFVVSDISSKIPVIYTLTGRLATSVNRIHDFMVLPIGIESNSDKPATVTFQGVENLGDSLMLYDAKTEELLPMKSGTKKQMPGRTQNRFFIVKGSNLEEAIDESNLQIHVDEGIITVASITGEPISEISAYDAGGRQVYGIKPNTTKHRFRLPRGIYVVKANTESTQRVKKVGN
ncbi:MAG: hypothetical protein IJL35_04830 [Bacteroidaceae bacterium]|nr:hypothetical protein [Bacteroidaceae bacterium]